MVNTNADGSHTHLSSLSITRTPQLDKKLITPIGDTSMGLQGKKYLSLLNGASSATPSPPFVSISRIELITARTERLPNGRPSCYGKA